MTNSMSNFCGSGDITKIYVIEPGGGGGGGNVTGFTYDNANNLTILQTGYSALTVNISIMTGLTIINDLTVNGDTFLQDLSASTLSILNIDTGTTSNNVLVYNDITRRVEKIDNVCFGNIDGGNAFSILLELNINGGGA